jgi:hypothetical protein
MLRIVVLLAVLGLGVCCFIVVANSGLAQDKPATAPADNGGADTKSDDAAKKKTDRVLGVDWGDEKPAGTATKDNADNAAPSKDVDLETVLTDIQKKRLEMIKKNAAEGDKKAELAQSALDGKNKTVKKADAVGIFKAAGGLFQTAANDIQSFAKGITDQDAKLSVLRQYGDTYKKRACELLCKAGMAAIDVADGKIENLKTAVAFFSQVRKIDPNYPGIKDGLSAAEAAANDIIAKQKAEAAAKANQSSNGGGSDPTNKSWDPNSARNYGNPTAPYKKSW